MTIPTACDGDGRSDERPLRPEVEQGYQDDFRASMNAVVRFCRDVVNEHSHHGNWSPRGDSPTHDELIAQARRDILSRLHLVLTCAEAVATEIERDRQRPHRRRPE
ncbi:hypothetical protein AB0G74_14285 [Streptomyces sp. NPDC020875]|uniref:hypothetical protein n=1 Tax=Streptomyces sp. NPDC020875 TaxID=3154898 RepID=UPI0033CCBB59